MRSRNNQMDKISNIHYTNIELIYSDTYMLPNAIAHVNATQHNTMKPQWMNDVETNAERY